MGKATGLFVATKYRGLRRSGRSLDAELFHSASQRVGMEVKNSGSPARPFDNAARFLQDLKNMGALDILKRTGRISCRRRGALAESEGLAIRA